MIFKFVFWSSKLLLRKLIHFDFLKTNIQFNFILVLALVLLSGCSLKKNTWSTRTYHSINTRFNVYFNGITSYNEGLTNISNSNKDDYSAIINMYPISKHENASSALSNMDRAIEKSRKAIKLHSIKQKPERNAKKWNNPEYKLWYNQPEFNPALKEAWLLLGKSEFHKGDFIGAVGTFSYLSRYYSSDKEMVARCQLWLTRSYAEMNWIYEAEEMLTNIKQDDLSFNDIGLFASVNADLLLKKQLYKEAIPFLELALKKEKSKDLKLRFSFLLAQLYKQTNNEKEAFDVFSKIINMNPPYEMDFNARIYKAELNRENVAAVRKDLNKMLKNSNNKDFQDQIYYTLGKTYFQQKDTAKAIEFYNLSVEKSTRNGFDKALTLITLGDLYYSKQNYIKAQPCYDEASKIITADHPDYKRVSKYAETLGELAVQNDIVVLQDSLQYLSTLSESKRLEIVKKLIAKLIEDEKAEMKAKEELNESNNNNNFNPEDGFDAPRPIGGNMGAGGDWYFYNPTLIKSGITDFQKKWGKRKLEDNWRRTNKAASLFAEEESVKAVTAENKNDTLKSATTDLKSPEFYLKQIPVTASQIEKSNAEIADALFNMAMIYKDKVEDYGLAIKTFNEFNKRFPDDKRNEEAYFQSFMIESKQNKTEKADIIKQKLIKEYPNSRYVDVISQPDYFERMARMYREQDSLYNETYTAYNSSDFNTVRKNVNYIQKQYPLCTLLPKFKFLEALSIGKTDKPEVFETALNKVVTDFPTSDVSAMSKDILALINQGNEAKKGSSHGTLLTRRDEELKTETEQIVKSRQFSSDKTLKHRLLIVTELPVESLNKLLYNIAAYNFTRFMVKDFDLLIGKIDSTHNALSVTNFESYDETQWYKSSVEADVDLNKFFKEINAKNIIISEENFVLMRSLFGMSEYQNFEANNLNSKTPNIDKPIAKATITNVKTPVKENKVIAKPKLEEPKVAMQKLDTLKKVQTVTAPILDVEKSKIVESKPVESKPVEKAPVVETIEPPVPLFKGLFGYRANEAHFVAIAVVSGNFDFQKLKASFDSYNAKNYSMLNLKLRLETVGKKQVVIIGQFADANLAKSYLIRMVDENSLFESLKDADYRNLLGSQKNLNLMMEKNAMETYFEFMQEYYLK